MFCFDQMHARTCRLSCCRSHNGDRHAPTHTHPLPSTHTQIHTCTRAHIHQHTHKHEGTGMDARTHARTLSHTYRKDTAAQAAVSIQARLSHVLQPPAPLPLGIPE